MLLFPVLRQNDKHKFVKEPKRFLNELVTPSPNLPVNDVFDEKTGAAVWVLKRQLSTRFHQNIPPESKNRNVDLYTWALIGFGLGGERLLRELRNINDNELRSLLLGMKEVQAIAYYSAEMEACDKKIAEILGGKNAIAAANGFEPEGYAIAAGVARAKHGYPLSYNNYRGDLAVKGETSIGHLSKHALHLYGSSDGTRWGADGSYDTEIYIPDGFRDPDKAARQTPTPTSATVVFYFKKFGNYTDVTLLVSHVADFGVRRDGNRWRIGKTGGLGGEGADYRHAHLDLLRGDVGLAIKYGKNGEYEGATEAFRKPLRLPFAAAFCP